MKEEVVLKTSDGESIHCRHYQNGRRAVIVIAHGFYAHKETPELVALARSLSVHYDVFMFDFRGHGKSSGRFSWAAREKNDLKAVFAYLKGRYATRGLIAFSLGAFVSFSLLAEEKNLVQSFVAVSPVSEFSRIDFRFWKLRWKEDLLRGLRDTITRAKRVRIGPFWLAKIDPIRIVGTLSVPILYIHGEKDWVVRHWHSRSLYERTSAQRKLVIITDGPHAEYLLNHRPKEIESLLLDWFAETLNKEPQRHAIEPGRS